MKREILIVLWLVLAVVLGVALIGGHRFSRDAVEAGRGKPRDVPMELLLRRIEERRLSDKEALFYERVGGGKGARAGSRPQPPPSR